MIKFLPKKSVQKSKKPIAKPAGFSFEKKFPYTSCWLKSYGWIEIGEDDYSGYFIKVLDAGGMLWHSKKNYKYKDMDAAFQTLEKALAAILKKEFGE